MDNLHASTPQLPAGYWELESSENPAPISPMAESFFLDAQTAGVRHLCTELGMLLETVQWRAIGGWVYLQSVPFAGDEQAVGERLRRCVEAAESDLTGRYLDRWDSEWRPWLIRRSTELAVDLPGLDAGRLAAHLDEVIAFVFAATDVHCLLHGPNAMLLGELVFACRDLLGWTEAQALDLVSGTSSASTEPAVALAQLAAMARDRAALRDLLADPAAAASGLHTDPEFAAPFESFRANYGWRATRYEVIEPCFAEQPELLLRMIRDQLDAGFDPVGIAQRVADRQGQARAAARAELAERYPEARARFDRVLERAARFYPMREDNEVWTQTVPLGLARRVLLEVGARLVEADALDRRDDVFLLSLEEVRHTLGSGEDQRKLVTTRQIEREQAFAAPGPPSYGPPPAAPDLSALPEVVRAVHEAVGWVIDRIVAPAAAGRRQHGTAIDGVPASPGRYTGPVRIVREASDLGRLRPGDVVVCTTIPPAWAVAFGSVGAVVADTGGILSHLAIIAREFAIPAVVGTGNATGVFRDGQVATVDGDAGTVVPRTA